MLNNVFQSRDEGTPQTKIEIFMKVDIASFYNDGRSIEIVKEEETGILNPELVFGNIRVSSNYDNSKERYVSGRNGIGIKATNIFSKEFSVEISDPKTKKKYEQKWENNMGICGKPKITKGNSSYVKISFVPDFE